MNRRIKSQVRSLSSGLLACGVCFVFGCALGGFVSRHLSGSGYETARAVIDSMLSPTDEQGIVTRLYSSAVTAYRIPFYMCAAGMTSLAPAAIPLLFSAKGFLLTFFLGSFAKVLGGSGVLKALALILPSELMALPCLVGLGMLALAYAGGSGYGITGQEYLNSCVKCMCFTALAVLADTFISPYLLSILG